MQFTTLTFLVVFLPLLVITYYFTPSKYRNLTLLIFSLIFYSCGDGSFFVIICILTFVNTGLAWTISGCQVKNKVFSTIILVLGIIMNVGVLGFYKYWGLFENIINGYLNIGIETQNVLLPLGISFYSFKAISLLTDIYCKRIENFSHLEAATYLTLFTQIQSGPIQRYNGFSGNKNFSEEFISEGVVTFMRGFVKKIIIADVLSQIVSEVFDSTVVLSTSLAWLGAICFSLQLYYDFSGYSDMAIGIGKMLGIDCELNFDYPYISKSISEFWRRWHISLGSWFRDYIYIPLGGSRVSRTRIYFNLFCVWFLTGLWHGVGWQFVAWGMGYFVLISFEKTFDFPNGIRSWFGKILYRIFTLLFVNFQWVLFRSDSLKEGLRFVKTMIVYSKAEVPTMRAYFLLKDYFCFILAAIIFSMPISGVLREKIQNIGIKAIYNCIEGIALVVLFVIAISFVVSGQNNPFLYGNF